MAWQWEAKGHKAKVLLFDDETVFVPLNKTEVRRLINAWRDRMDTLASSADYPEVNEDRRLYDNLITADFLLNQLKNNKG
jgi:hypothetical protein